MSNTPSKAEIEALVKRHGATSYRNRADTQHPAYGFTEDGLNGLIDEVLAKWGTPAPVGAEPVALLVRKNSWRDGQWEVAPPNSPSYGLAWANQRKYRYTTPQPAQQRVIDEKAARDGEVSRLAAFIDSNPVFPQLPADEQARLRRQLDVMRELSVVLGERIAHF